MLYSAVIGPPFEDGSNSLRGEASGASSGWIPGTAGRPRGIPGAAFTGYWHSPKLMMRIFTGRARVFRKTPPINGEGGAEKGK